MAPLVSIIIVTYNRLELLKRSVGTVMENTAGDFELIIWNNGSTDGTRRYLDSLCGGPVRVVHHGQNIGLNALNPAFAEAQADTFVSMDDDVRAVPPGWLERMLEAFRVVGDLGFLCAGIEGINRAARELGYRRVDYGRGVVLLEGGPVGGWCFMIPRRVFEDMGGFIEVPGLVYFYHDIDFVARIEEQGYRAGVLCNVVVDHVKAPRTPIKERDRRRFGRMAGTLWKMPASWLTPGPGSDGDDDGQPGE